MSETIPSAGFDSTLSLLRQGYDFIGKHCDELGTDVFRTRLMLEDVICLRGPDASRMFYGEGRFTRRQAMPASTLRLLQDKGSVQLLDGEAHRHRKRMFMQLMTPEKIAALCETFERCWKARLPRWEKADEIVLFDELREILTEASGEWIGLPVKQRGLDKTTREIAAMLDQAGSVGPANWHASLLRSRTEEWIDGVVEDIREGKTKLPPDAPAAVIATHRDLNGNLLSVEEATVEIINLLRPTVAIGRFITFAALALHEHPECRKPLAGTDEVALESFVQEVRRYYPFFPFIGGRTLEAFEWNGIDFPANQWVILDLYGTDHDPRTYEDAGRFDPDRFRNGVNDAFGFVPQGGGDYIEAHRCPGEAITIAVMKTAVRILTRDLDYELPEQDFTVSASDLPAAPRGGMRMTGIRPISDAWRRPA